MNRRHELSEKQWQKFKEYLPPQKPETGRPAEDHRKIINGIFWKVRTGAPWRDIPERYGPWTTIYSRFRRWRDAGVWNRILAELQAESDSEGHVDWTIHFVDTTIVRAHQHAAGAKKRGQRAEALGRSRGGFSTKVHLRAEGEGKPITLGLTPGEAHDTTAFLDLMEHGAIKRLHGGRPRIRPDRLVGDKGFSAQWIRDYLARHGIHVTIPRKSNNKRGGPFDRQAYKMRNRVERLINCSS